ncbi:protein ROOT INITIATION DEFECTIVE 3-like [Quillaja saponaria]|uniref:Protein ROOT INITIATION DEFECTIVE 3-like n=1 Tax=Quillaja saponaria TaxID=32244 RepID=A0AAD7VMU8_QUISA|nr:protein ROOT INITIATION DEFECTIVE 3-like [Quillaja saponaria]
MSPSSHEIVLTSSPDGPIIAYHISNGTTIAHFSGSRSPPQGLTLAGESLFAASHVSSAHYQGQFTSITGTIRALSLPNGDILNSFPAHRKPISCLELNHDGSLLISDSDDGSIVVIPVIQLLDVSPGAENPNEAALHRLSAHTNSVTAITSGMGFCNPTLISCSLDCTCKFWNLSWNTPTDSDNSLHYFWVALDPLESEFYCRIRWVGLQGINEGWKQTIEGKRL